MAGTYTGSATLRYITFGLKLDGTARFVVVQAGPQLTITAEMTFVGETLSFGSVTGTINETGFFTVTSEGSNLGDVDPTCGRLTSEDGTLSFAGRTLTYQASAVFTECGTVHLSSTASR